MAVKNLRKDESRPDLGLEEVKEILDLLEQRGISEFEIERNGFRLRIKRELPHLPPAHHLSAISHGGHAGASQPAAPPQPSAPSAPSAPAHAEESTEGLHIVRSPIVGTFYASPSPDAPSYVKVGDTIQKGDVLCLIEAMKLMNEIEADVSGQLVRHFVENGQPVEYGQSLFGIKPLAST
jgi:acetyl-CoA carboxylase biotin carboxyl carrier protein